MQTITLAAEKKDEPISFNYFNRLSKLVKETHNSNWMKDWMDQSTNYKHNPEALKLISNDVEGFIDYAKLVKGK